MSRAHRHLHRHAARRRRDVPRVGLAVQHVGRARARGGARHRALALRLRVAERRVRGLQQARVCPVAPAPHRARRAAGLRLGRGSAGVNAVKYFDRFYT